MIISIDAEEVFDKIHTHLWYKLSRKQAQKEHAST